MFSLGREPEAWCRCPRNASRRHRVCPARTPRAPPRNLRSLRTRPPLVSDRRERGEPTDMNSTRHLCASDACGLLRTASRATVVIERLRFPSPELSIVSSRQIDYLGEDAKKTNLAQEGSDL